MCATYDLMKQADKLSRSFSQQLCVALCNNLFLARIIFIIIYICLYMLYVFICAYFPLCVFVWGLVDF